MRDSLPKNLEPDDPKPTSYLGIIITVFVLFVIFMVVFLLVGIRDFGDS
jgi:hypothetical protein